MNKSKAYKSIAIYLILVIALSSIFHLAIVKLYPSSIYIGGLMWCPALATFVTLKWTRRPITSLNWRWPDLRHIKTSYFVPFLYVTVTYVLIWLFGLGGFSNEESIIEWANNLGLMGIGSLKAEIAVIIGVVLLATVGVIKSMATVLGEEIGWRGFFVHELRKVSSFTGTSLISGIIWALWHWPVIVYYGNNVLLEFTTFLVVIISMSFIMTYCTFKSKSLWPAVIFHAVSNVYVQKIYPPLTSSTDTTEIWHGEYGIMFAMVTVVFGLFYWRKAVHEKL
ncbi:MAG: CPBP family intramembrane metalloprotease [Balneola sp.]|jgi:membrane protease YdiL (CAAX protease family)|nr:CPBP family intramembrane metalloprotease [Balneola sp.]MBE77578.1 CPBP family intramembrane metalloprotease [Balneola sp.]|tara:strand:- start:21708 stop:22547 length:840 start_codon:yes stop_codon:yes gene_type:complete